MAGAKKTYDRLANNAEPWRTRARENARFTIPALFPENGTTGQHDLANPHQSLGSRGVKNLAAKLLLILLPPNIPFFRYSVGEFELDALKGDEGVGQVQKALSKAERAVMSYIGSSNLRTVLYEALKQLLIAGNVLIWHERKSNRYRMFRMDSYVVRRKSTGEVIELCIHEQQMAADLPEEVREACNVKASESEGLAQKQVDVYTYARQVDNKYEIRQEINNTVVPGTLYTRPLNNAPFIAARLYPESGEDWGRSYVEEYIGSLISYDGLKKSIHDGAAAMAKILLMLRPGSATRPKDLEKPNLSIIHGLAQDVSVLQVEKGQDFRVALEASRDDRELLEFAFLLHSAAQRNAERVTAEEVRFMAGELEDALGGVYSGLSVELQLPLVRINEASMQASGMLPKMPKEVTPTITTGLQALGRGHDLARLRAFGQDIANLGGPELLQRVANEDELVRRIAAGHGIDTDGLVLSQEEMQQRMMQEQMLQLAQSAGPGVAEQVTKSITEGGPVSLPQGE